ncbi:MULTISPECIES: hypothetical protein [Paenibacillus]|uniref:Uncharacterized protein n=1 Tax=Paenibacillus naphthalenovorans TaxID=162209 RepID=A0A0U2U3M6_9BACL|nr:MULTISPECIES: hypothetical protein [Paenibacillus]ALS20936.1 hypothetical protein IJ22_05490 [Paenibacillus naphthalenovorans]GCL70969.1 hypothetical protein PN4B1_08730 [Paenibacillus naphthalenovorans]SDI59089.1 hypothetical protein SAMN05421868_10841 [Paenibacillus naphthalenovorans]
MNKAQAGKWRKTRQMGKAKYVMYYGVVTWGLLLTFLFTAVEWFSQQSFNGSWFTIRLVVFSIVGFFIANFRWDANERTFLTKDAE